MENTVIREGFVCSPISIVGLLLVLMIILNWVIIPLFESNIRYALLHFFFCFLCDVMQIDAWEGKSKTNERSSILGNEQSSKEIQIEVAINNLHENVIDEKQHPMSIGELGQIMETLGTLGKADGLFEEDEPSLEEVQEAFHVFDENKDGFIDAREVKKVLCALGFAEASEVECQRMIRAFDDNGDGLIDFNEFVQLMENSFC